MFAEQRSLRWSVVREALWLRQPRSPRTGRVGGRLWLLLIPLIAGLAAEELIPQINHPMNRDFGAVMGTHSFTTFLHGNGAWFAVYHLHVPWAIPGALVDTFLLAYPSKRYRSAWIGICVHSARTVVLGLGVLAVVL